MKPAKRKPAAPVDPGMQGSEVQLRRDRELLRKGYTFDVAAADWASGFFSKYLRHYQGRSAGKPFDLAEWQLGPIRRAYGWKRPDGFRRYRKQYWKVPRKNGKTAIAAGQAALLTFGDGEGGAQVYSAANGKEQAKLAYKDCAQMVRSAPELLELCDVMTNAIVIPRTMSVYSALSSESSNKDGLNVHGLLIDELHEWEDRELWEKLTTAQGARMQPMTVITTTAGWDPNSLWAEEDDYAHRVADGSAIADDYLPVIYEAGPKDDWHSLEVWKLANPGYGISLDPAFIEAQHREAVEKPAFENAFKRYHLNIRTEQAVRWMPMDKWDKCKGSIDLESLKGQKCWIGLDLSKRYDITAKVKVFKVDQKLVVVPTFFIPEEGLAERAKRDKVPFERWVKDGLIVATPGDVVDYEFIQASVLEDARDFEVVDVAYDPYSATQLAIQLTDHGVNAIEFPQNIGHMSEPTKALLIAVLQRRLVHGGNPVLRWMAANAKAIVDANDNVKLVKNKSIGRIDGVVASIMGIARATLAEDQTSMYEQPGATL